MEDTVMKTVAFERIRTKVILMLRHKYWISSGAASSGWRRSNIFEDVDMGTWRAVIIKIYYWNLYFNPNFTVENKNPRNVHVEDCFIKLFLKKPKKNLKSWTNQKYRNMYIKSTCPRSTTILETYSKIFRSSKHDR